MDYVYERINEESLNPESFSYSNKIMWSLLYPGHGREPKSIKDIRQQEKKMPSRNEVALANEAEITNCDKKSAYITNSDEITLEKDFISKYYSRKMYTGDIILQKIEGWLVYNVKNTKVISYYRWLIDSGIYERLAVVKFGRQANLRNKANSLDIKTEKISIDGVSSLSGGLVTLFILCGGLILLALTTFLFECRHIICKTLVKCYLQ
jgi:hypothetical protein